jgi:hypothetical protein
MKKLAVCTVGVVVALLLGGLSSVDQIHSAVGTGASVVYAAQSATAPACLEIGSTPSVVAEGCRLYVRCRIFFGEGEIGIECEIGWDCD